MSIIDFVLLIVATGLLTELLRIRNDQKSLLQELMQPVVDGLAISLGIKERKPEPLALAITLRERRLRLDRNRLIRILEKDSDNTSTDYKTYLERTRTHEWYTREDGTRALRKLAA